MLKNNIYLTFFITIVAVFVLGKASLVAAQTLPEEGVINTPTVADLSDTYYRAKVLAIIETGEKEVEEGRLPKDLGPLQAGIGSIANAVLTGLKESNFEPKIPVE